jgi:hypothetical protein
MLRALLIDNIGWKLFALAVSVLLWWGLVGEPTLTTSISVPVQYLNMPADSEFSSDVLERVHLEIRGPSSKLTPEALQEAAVVLNLRQVSTPGERTFPIADADVFVPIGVKLIRAVPSQVRLNFERRLARSVPVIIRFATPPPEGYEIMAQTADPPQVRILGPESRVSEIQAVETDPVNLAGVVSRAEFSVEVFVPDAQVRLDSPRRVRISIEVRKKGPAGN